MTEIHAWYQIKNIQESTQIQFVHFLLLKNGPCCSSIDGIPSTARSIGCLITFRKKVELKSNRTCIHLLTNWEPSLKAKGGWGDREQKHGQRTKTDYCTNWNIIKSKTRKQNKQLNTWDYAAFRQLSLLFFFFFFMHTYSSKLHKSLAIIYISEKGVGGEYLLKQQAQGYPFISVTILKRLKMCHHLSFVL